MACSVAKLTVASTPSSLVQLLLDARGARGTRHPLEIEADLSGLQRTGHALDYTTRGYLTQTASVAGSGAACGAIA